MLPDFFIAGAAKSGTTSLYHYLDAHPEVYMSPIKEPNHFCTDINPENFSDEFKLHERQKKINLSAYVNGPMTEKHWGYFVTDRNDYEKLFKNRTKEKVAGEVSNSYLYSKVAAFNIIKAIPGAKVIIMLRNPADRAYSHYLANVRDGKTFLPFKKELQKDAGKSQKGWGQSYLYFEMGLYYEQVFRYLQHFPADQVKIYLYDDFKLNSAGIMKNIFQFLKIAEMPRLDFSEKHNEAKEPVSSRLLYWASVTGFKKEFFQLVPDKWKKNVKAVFFRKKAAQPMQASDRKYLVDMYREDITKLAQLINRDLGAWLK